jgi:hypothetical protein
MKFIPDRQKFGGAAVIIDYIFYKKGMNLLDIDNAICSVNDVLQHEQIKIIDNDKQVMKGSFEFVPGCDKWVTEIVISELPSPVVKRVIPKIPDRMQL